MLRRRTTYGATNHGFTIIELIVIAPVVLLTIGAFITIIVSMTGDVLSSRQSSTIVYNIQDSLNRIEQDIKLSSSFLAVNNITPLTSPQGLNDDTTSYKNVGTSNGNVLILNTLATSGNPLQSTSSLIYASNAPNACGSTQITQNKPQTVNTIYFVKSGTLWRRTIMQSNYLDNPTSWCSMPWQQPSCTPGYVASFCKTQDVRLVSGLGETGFSVQYYNGADSTVVNSTASSTGATDADRGIALQSATTASVSLNVTQTVAGRDISQSGTIRATRLDINASTIAPVIVPVTPIAPTLTGSIPAPTTAPTSVQFTWPTVPGATGYTFQYNINGGAWQTGFTNQNTTTYTVVATHTNVVNARATATNSAGTSGYSATSTITVPLWATPVLQNNWTDYNNTYATAAYTKTSAGVVVLKGLIKSGTATSGTVIFNLPVGYRPATDIIFQNITNTAPGRVDISSSGNVRFEVGSNAWYSLDGISFMPSGNTFTNVTPLLNSWVIYGAPWNTPPGYLIDGSGRVRIQGMVTGGVVTSGTAIVTLPAAARPPQYTHTAIDSNNTNAHYSIQATDGNLVAKGYSNAWYALQGLYYPTSYSATGTTCATVAMHVDDGWCNITLQNGWVFYGAPYSTPQYTRSSDGLVVLKGLIRSGTATDGTTLFTLPAGYRPSQRLLLSSEDNGSWARIDVLPNGLVTIQSNGNSAWLALDSIHFMAEQ